jgi:hypothetical protein
MITELYDFKVIQLVQNSNHFLENLKLFEVIYIFD